MTIPKYIYELLEGHKVAWSRITDCKLRSELMEQQLLMLRHHGRKTICHAPDVVALKRHLSTIDEKYRLLDAQAADTRGDLARDTGNSKLERIKSCPGFPVSSYEPILCQLACREIIIDTIPGTFLFISDWNNFNIPADVTIVGIENMENFRYIRQQKLLFETCLSRLGLSTKILFVSRFPVSIDLAEWLKTVPNPYVHFGDFDLAGISIYLNEFQKKIGSERSFLLIPLDIEKRLINGTPERYNNQLGKYRNLSSDCPEVQHLIDLIHKYKKGYDQEGYENKPI